MTDIPEPFMTAVLIALTGVERSPYLSKSRDRAKIIARALMAADEAATKRAADLGYHICAEHRDLTLGASVRAAILKGAP